jgi:hypothetical protein
LVFGLVACGGKGAARLEGKWRGIRAEGVPPESQTTADDFARATSLEFKDESISIKSPHEAQTGRYRIEKEDKTSITLVTDKDGTRDPQKFVFIDAKTFKWTVVEGRVIVFAKQQ